MNEVYIVTYVSDSMPYSRFEGVFSTVFAAVNYVVNTCAENLEGSWVVDDEHMEYHIVNCGRYKIFAEQVL